MSHSCFPYSHFTRIRLTRSSFTHLELPEAPQNVEVTEVESRALRFKWEEVPGQVLSYLVQYRDDYSDVWKNLSISSNSLSAHITALSPSARYKIRVLAANELGTSESSKQLTVYTLEEGEFSFHFKKSQRKGLSNERNSLLQRRLDLRRTWK